MSTDQGPGPVETGASAAPASAASGQQTEEEAILARLDALAKPYDLTREQALDVVLRVGLALEGGTFRPSDALPDAAVVTGRGVEDVLHILIRNGLSIDNRTLGLRIEEMATECGITPDEVRAVLVRRGLDACEQFHAQLCAQSDEEPETQRFPEAPR